MPCLNDIPLLMIKDIPCSQRSPEKRDRQRQDDAVADGMQFPPLVQSFSAHRSEN